MRFKSRNPIVATSRIKSAAAKEARAAARAAAVAAGGGDDGDGDGGGEDGGGAAGGAQQRGRGTRKFEKTPSWLTGGELHPYQLEGLNWLYHSCVHMVGGGEGESGGWQGCSPSTAAGRAARGRLPSVEERRGQRRSQLPPL
jgi:hypothetical protein